MKKLFTYVCIFSLLAGSIPSFSQSQIDSIVPSSLNIAETKSIATVDIVKPSSKDKKDSIAKTIVDIKTFKVDGKEVKFEAQPILLNKTIMIPMKEFFQALGCDVKWINDTKEVIAYKNNMFVKLKIDNLTAYKNGKAQTLKEPPIIYEGRTLVPADFIAETFDMNIEYNAKLQTVDVTSTENTNKYTILNNSFYKEQLLRDYGVSISTPTFWSSKDGLDNTFEYKDDFEYYQLVVNKQDIDNTLSLNRFTELHKAKLLKAYGDSISFNGKSILRTDNFSMNVVFLTTMIENEKRNQILYFITANGTGYIITCTYGLYVNEEYAMDLFNNILSTFQVNNLTLNSEEEHYFEFDSYFKNKIKIETEIYSNMAVENSIIIKGTLSPNHSIKELKAIVSKEKEQLEFPITIQGNAFSGTLYLPFGLGKHNVVLAGIEKGANVSYAGEPVTVYVNDALIKATESNKEKQQDTIEKSAELTAKEELEEIKALTEKLNQQNTSDVSSDATAASTADKTKENSNEEKVTAAMLEQTNNDTTVKEINYDNIEDFYIMKFSVVNLSNEKIRYQIPSRLINSDSMDLYNTANYITYKSSSDYAKSRTIFQWVSENINIITPENNSLPARTSLEILKSKTATQEEVPILYCALLRSLNIPSRVMIGHFDGEVSYWTEILLNGTWIVSNPTWEILYRDELTKNNAYTNYFNIYRPSHYGTFETINLLPY